MNIDYIKAAYAVNPGVAETAHVLRDYELAAVADDIALSCFRAAAIGRASIDVHLRSAFRAALSYTLTEIFEHVNDFNVMRLHHMLHDRGIIASWEYNNDGDEVFSLSGWEE